ncbi:MAG: AI-2E family transporter [Oscillospiraceae bacterium]|nr:AI-2E family transporter [Oscillospiraceae bacterium]
MKLSNRSMRTLKGCVMLGSTALAVFLIIHYWGSIAGFAGLLCEGCKPLVIGAAIAYLINILMQALESRLPHKGVLTRPDVRRGLSIFCALFAIIGLIVLLLCLILPQLVSCIRTLALKAPTAVNTLLANPLLASVIPEDWESQLTHINWTTVISKAADLLRSGLTGGATVISTGFSAAVEVVLGIVFALYILLDKDRLHEQVTRVGRAYLKPEHAGRIRRYATVLDKNFHNYVVGQCVEAVILGTLCALGMLVLRLPYAAMIGALVGVTALIPVAGCWIGAGVGAFMILAVSPTKALVFLIFLLILQQLENNLIYPKVVGSSVGLSGIWVLAAVTVGGTVMGMLGMMAAVPVAASIYQLLREDVSRRLGAAGPVREDPQEGSG